MRQRVTRFIALISERLPDLSRVPQRRQIVGALIVSALVHLALVVVLIVGSKVVPAPVELPLVESKPLPVREIEVQLVPPAPPAVAEEPPVFDPKGMEKAKAAPERPVFQSS